MSSEIGFDSHLVARGLEEYERNPGFGRALIFSTVTAANLGALLEAIPQPYRADFEEWLLDIARFPGTPIGWGKPLAPDIREAALRLLEPKGGTDPSKTP